MNSILKTTIRVCKLSRTGGGNQPRGRSLSRSHEDVNDYLNGRRVANSPICFASSGNAEQQHLRYRIAWMQHFQLRIMHGGAWPFVKTWLEEAVVHSLMVVTMFSAQSMPTYGLRTMV